MELNTKLIQNIAGYFGLSAEDMTAKLTGTDADIALKGQLFTDEELQSRDSGKYNEGKTAGVEMLVRDEKKKFGYEFEGRSFDDFLNHHDATLKNKYSKDSNERVTELEKDIDKLKLTYTTEIDGYKNTITSLESKYKAQTTHNALLGLMPKNTTIKPEALITLFKSDYELDTQEGAMVVKQNGQVLKDPKTTQPLEVSGVLNDWLVKENYIKNDGGRGSGNEFGNKSFNAKTPEDFTEQWRKQNPDKSTTSPEFQKDYQEFRAKT